MSRMALAMGALLLSMGGCDRFDPPKISDREAQSRSDDEARKAAREAMESVMKAAAQASASCTAGEIRWEADPDGNPVPRHFSRPCIPERCATKPEDIESLRASARALRGIVDGDPVLRVPSFQGFAALADAMVGFADTAMAGTAKAKDKPARLSGLSMHYGALAASYHEMFSDSVFPPEPPSLTASLAAPGAGGDACKGWAMPKYCDVRGVRIPKERTWRSDPPCVEVEGIKR